MSAGDFNTPRDAPMNTKTIQIEVWLYGPVSRYASDVSQGTVLHRRVQRSHAELHLELPQGSTVQDLLDYLGLPREEKGITFVNGRLAALPGVDPDRDLVLHDGDRVGIFHRRSMWPFQYRFGSQQDDRLRQAFRERKDRGIRHAYTEPDE